MNLPRPVRSLSVRRPLLVHVGARVSENAMIQLCVIPRHDQGARPAGAAAHRRPALGIFSQFHVVLLLHHGQHFFLDTMSGLYAEFVEKEVLPMVEKQYNVKLTKDPEGGATMGGSSGGSCALIMAWYHTELYHRVLTYSGTYVNQQWPPNAETPHGAWEFHEHLIPNTAAKPLRIWMEVGDRDLFNPNVMRDNMHDWVVANENMAKVLAAKGYHYQFVFARNAGHSDRTVKQQTLPEALEYLWQGYPIGGAKKNE